MRKILIAGIGSVLVGDDGIGPYVVRRLEATYAFDEGVEIEDLGTPALDLIDHIAGLDVLIVVDAVENGKAVANVRIFQRLNSASTHVGLAHSNHETDHDRPFHQSLPVLCTGREMFVDMHRVLVHAQQAEQRIVELGNGAAGPMPEFLSGLQVFEITAVSGRDQATEDSTNAPIALSRELGASKEIPGVHLRHHWAGSQIGRAVLFVLVNVGHHGHQLPAVVRQSLQFALIHLPVLGRRRFMRQYRLQFIPRSQGPFALLRPKHQRSHGGRAA